MFDFPVWFDHIEMALWRVFVTIAQEVAYTLDNGEDVWYTEDRQIEVGTFLSRNMAKVHYDNIDLSDYVDQNDLDSHLIQCVEASFEKWHIDECNAAEYGATIEEKQLF